MGAHPAGESRLSKPALIREADLRRLVKVIMQEAPGARMTIDLDQNRLHFVLSNKQADTPDESVANPLDWLLNDNDPQTGAPK